MAYEQIFEEAGKQFNVDPALLRAQMQVESSGDPKAQSEKGAQGLMQLIPATQKALGVTNPNDPRQSIFASAELMAQNLDRYGNVADAVRAYHGGTDQANWGPKTQAYVSKVMKGYGAPAQQSSPAAAGPNDDLAADFASPTATGSSAHDDLAADFAAPGAAQGSQQATAQTGMPSDVEPPQSQQAQPQADQSILGMAGRGLESLGAQGISNANAIGRGISDAFDAPAEWAAAGAEKSGLTGLLAKAGINMPTEAQQIQMNKDSRAEYDARNPEAGLQGMASRVGGNIAATAAPIGMAGRALASGGNALLGAVRGAPAIAGAAPALQAAGNLVAGNGGMLSRMANMGAQGGAGAALLSGASDTPLSEQVGVGAVLGAALPPAYSAVSGLMRGAKSTANLLTQPFTERGRQTIANKIVSDEAAAAGGVPQTSIPYTMPGSSGTSFTPGATGIPGTPPAPGAALATSVDDILGKSSAGGKLDANFNEIIPGSRPTLSQATGNAGIATLERGMAARSAEAANAFNELQQANHAARLDFFNGLRGNPQTLQAAITQREEQALPMLSKALDGAGIADSAPVMSKIQAILKGPAGQQDAVQSALRPIAQKLKINPVMERDPLIPGTVRRIDPNGNGLQYDVSQLYGIRKSINDQLEKVSGRDNSASQLASSELLQVKKSLDDAIEKAAPGFGDYLKTYSELSKPVTSQSYLQNLDLTDQTSSQLTLNKVKSAVNKIERLRKGSGANEAKDISPDQMDGLYRLQADLQREANSSLGRVKGSSDTTQLLRQNNLIDVMLGGVGGKAAGAAPTAMGTGLGYLIGGPAGAAMGGLVGQNLGSAAGKAISSQAPAIEANLLQMLTRPQGPEVLQALTPKGSNPLLERVMNKGAAGVFSGGNKN